MERYVYVGTYTQDILFGTGEILHGRGKGIYRLKQDIESGALCLDTVWSGIDNPSFLTLNQKQDRLYAVNELKTYEGTFGGTVSAFKIDGQNLEPMGRLATGGSDPCHVTLFEEKRTLYVANFMSGSVSVFSLASNGALSERIQLIQHDGKSVNPIRQAGPHAHSVVINRDFAYVPDLGLDSVICYQIERDGTLKERPDLCYNAEPGSGPRHMVFDQSGDCAYVINELTSSVASVKYCGGSGPVQINCQSTLPKDSLQVDNSCACIHLNHAGMFLYASNRGHNSIAVYRVLSDHLEQIGCYSSHGEIPRDFVITPDDRFLICANQSSDELVVFKLNPDNGLMVLRQTMQIPTPVCVVAL